MKAIFLGGAVALALAVSANADIIPALANITPGSEPYTWNYLAHLTSLESLDPGATNGNTCGGSPCNPPGTFFTIYDFAGYVQNSISATSAGWTASTQPVGKTPQNVTPADNPGVTNLVFTYSGAVLAGPIDFGGFSAQSTINKIGTGMFATQATKNFGSLIGSTDQNVGYVEVPAHAPEPGYILLLLSVVASFVIWRVRAT